MQQARNLTADLGHRMTPLRFLLRDRDDKYKPAFATVFQADDLHVIKNAPRAPRMNAHCERAIGTIRRELLDHILILGEARPHQGRHQLPPDAQQHPAAIHDLDAHRLHRTRIRDGLINEYKYAP
ncbi:hypothetical protein [Saccharothrix sp. NRRL B-16348]|uniref:hypothetical protein n=1 Tax=Saccharothrix sp. NRRL B-16348 TaxID=1415542 RepID=UPI0006AEC472|nr:hypothetical protein [Saccharothrix sp. NRRL B-16348]